MSKSVKLTSVQFFSFEAVRKKEEKHKEILRIAGYSVETKYHCDFLRELKMPGSDPWLFAKHFKRPYIPPFVPRNSLRGGRCEVSINQLFSHHLTFMVKTFKKCFNSLQAFVLRWELQNNMKKRLEYLDVNRKVWNYASSSYFAKKGVKFITYCFLLSLYPFCVLNTKIPEVENSVSVKNMLITK